MACWDGFGDLADGRPFWIGSFSPGSAGRSEALFYYPGDDNWWLGTHDGTQLQWSFAGNTAGFGHAINDGRPFWTGSFSPGAMGRTEILFYYPGDDNWWLGTHDGNQFQWSFAGNTAGFGHAINDGRPFWIGSFSPGAAGRSEVLFYFPGDDNWWLGTHDGTQLRWSLVGNTAGFGHAINDGRPFWTGNFSRRASGRSEILFYYPGDDNWWLGSHDGSQLRWSFAGNTAGFGHAINDGRPFWIGSFSARAAGRSEVLFYYPGDDNWWLGRHDGNQLQWSFAGNTAGFGHAINDGRPFWIGSFSPGAAGRSEVLFYYPGDGNWWLGTHDSSQLKWTFAGNTGRSYNHRIRLFLKTLIAPTIAVDTMIANMRQVYATADILVEEGARETVTISLPGGGTQLDFNVGKCTLGQTPTTDQTTLFANRNSATSSDIVVYFVRQTIPPLNGCAAFPSGNPGAIVTQGASAWTMAHEVGHVLGLSHISGENTGGTCASADFTRLMTGCGTSGITGTPTISSSEISTMQGSSLTKRC
ncbi:MAG TPA: hypothetical protein VG323_04230 [Thermoanaerobaculia bacterium]|nr:hypothetical protein [Thermoanaerobaculia bacterium]